MSEIITEKMLNLFINYCDGNMYCIHCGKAMDKKWWRFSKGGCLKCNLNGTHGKITKFLENINKITNLFRREVRD